MTDEVKQALRVWLEARSAHAKAREVYRRELDDMDPIDHNRSPDPDHRMVDSTRLALEVAADKLAAVAVMHVI